MFFDLWINNNYESLKSNFSRHLFLISFWCISFFLFDLFIFSGYSMHFLLSFTFYLNYKYWKFIFKYLTLFLSTPKIKSSFLNHIQIWHIQIETLCFFHKFISSKSPLILLHCIKWPVMYKDFKLVLNLEINKFVLITYFVHPLVSDLTAWNDDHASKIYLQLLFCMYLSI